MRGAFIQERCVFWSPNFQNLFKLNCHIPVLSLRFDYIPLSFKRTDIKRLFHKVFRLAQTWLWLHMFFEFIIRINTASWWGTHSRVVFIYSCISALKWGIYFKGDVLLNTYSNKRSTFPSNPKFQLKFSEISMIKEQLFPEFPVKRTTSWGVLSIWPKFWNHDNDKFYWFVLCKFM